MLSERASKKAKKLKKPQNQKNKLHWRVKGIIAIKKLAFIRKMNSKIGNYKQGKMLKEKLFEIFQGWNACAKWADSYNLRKSVVRKIYSNSTR